jgi:hypothetical protein
MSIFIPIVNTFGNKGSIFLNIEFVISYSITLLITTQNYAISVMIFGFQLILVNWLSKTAFEQALYLLRPEEVLNVLFNICNLFAPAIFLTFAYYNYTLNQTLQKTSKANNQVN